MPDSSTLDQALNLISDFQQKKNEARTDIMEAILPEVLQLEEPKLAAASMKEEASKTLHAPKYDRRMKFNTALERSDHKATSEEPVQAKEDPAWLKEAAEEVLAPETDKPKLHPAALSALLGSMGAAQGSFYSGNLKKKLLAGGLGALGGAGIGALANHLVDKENTEIPSIVKNVPTALVGGGLLGAGFGSTARWLEQEHPKAFRRMPLAVGGGALGILGLKKLWDMKHDKQASDPAFDFAGVTGREGVVTVEDELERTPPLPLEEPMSYDVANKPVMQKSALYPDETETFTQRNPWVLPAGIGLLGAAAGAIPAGLLGGRHAVKAVQKGYDLRRGVLEKEIADAVRKSRNANKNWNLSQREFNEIKRMVPKKREALKNLEAPNFGMHETLGRIAGGTLGGLTGGSLGVLGGLAANRPQPWEQ